MTFKLKVKGFMKCLFVILCATYTCILYFQTSNEVDKFEKNTFQMDIVEEVVKIGDNNRKRLKGNNLYHNSSLDGSKTLKNYSKLHLAGKRRNIRRMKHLFHNNATNSTKAKPVLKFMFDYIITPKHLCICDKNTSVMIMILSKADMQERRDAIRKTWGAAIRRHIWPPKVALNSEITVVFVVGVGNNLTHNQSELLEEAREFDDIIQVNFTEDAESESWKSLVILKYVYEKCKNSTTTVNNTGHIRLPHVVKTSDNILIHIPVLLKKLFDKKTLQSRGIMGLCQRKSDNTIDKSRQKYIKPEIYPFKKVPKHLLGVFYVINGDILQELYYASRYIPLLPDGDAYVTGILAKIINAKHVCMVDTEIGEPSVKDGLNILVNKNKLVFMYYNPKQMIRLWSSIGGFDGQL